MVYMKELTREHYMEGIRRAEELGIVDDDEVKIHDHYGHVEMGMSSENTRDLAEEAADLVRMYSDCDDFGFLELGQGVGRACGQVSRIVQPGSQINSVALTPTNPWYMCRMKMHSVIRALVKMANENAGSKGSFCRAWMKECHIPREVLNGPYLPSQRYSLEMVFELQRETGIEVFTLLEEGKPFIDRCMVGGLPYGVDLPEGQFDMVYEDNGPFNKEDLLGKKDVLHEIVKSLSPRGVFFVCGHVPSLMDCYDSAVRDGVLTSRDAVVSVATSRAGYVLAKEDSPFLISLRNRVGGKVGGFYSLRKKGRAFYDEVMGNVN